MSERLEVAWSISVATLVVTSMIIVGSVSLAAPVTAQSGSPNAPQVTDTGADQPRTTPEDTPLTITGISVADADDGVTDANNDGNPDDVVIEAQFDVNGGTVDLANTNASATSGTDGSDAVTIQGSVAEINDALDGMTFTPKADQNSQVSGYDPDIHITFTDTTNSDSTSYTVDNLAVSAVNDAPAVDQSNATGLTVDEGGSASFAAPTPSGQGFTQGELGLSEIDNNAQQTIIKITSLPGQGSLTFNGNPVTTGSTLAAEDLDNLAYVHDGSQVTSTGTDTFNLTYDDGAGGLLTDQPVTVNLEPVNQPPSVGGTVTVIENETDVRLDNNGNLPTLGGSRGAINITDPEGDSITEYTIDSLPTEGTLYYDGNPVSAGDVVTDITQLTYSHDGSEPAPDSFDVSVTDNGGGAGNPKTAPGTVDLDIHPNNDDPTLTTNEEQTLSSGSSLTLTDDMLGLTDPDTADDTLTYTVTDVPDPADGYFEVDGQTLQAGASFTQADIDAGLVQYVNQNPAPMNSTRADSFSFTVQDGDFRILPNVREGGIYDTDAQNSPLTENNFTVNVTDSVTPDPDPVPADAPTNTPPSPGGSNTAALLESETVSLTSSMLNASDNEQSPGEIVYRLDSLPASGDIRLNGERLRVGQSFTQADVNNGNVTFAHGGGEDFVDSFDYTVSDGQATSDAQTFDLDVTPQNDPPSAETDTAFVNEDQSVTLTSAQIDLSDPDNSASDNETGFAANQNLNFTIDSLPGNGTLTLDGAAVTAGDTVTRAQLNNGELEYTHDGTENFTDNFAITPVDDAGVGSGDATATNASSTGAQVNVPIVIFPINDPPEPDFVSKTQLTTDEAGPVLEGDTATIGGATNYDTINGVPGTGEPTPVSGAHLSFGDNDSSSTQRQYRITTAPAHGQLLLNGKPVGVGSSFTQVDLDNGNIQYEHDGTEGADYGNADSFDYIVSDGDWQANDTQTFPQGTSATSSTYNIDIAQRNDVPELDAPDSLDAFASGAGTTAIPTITVDDPDLDDGIQSNETDFMRVELSVLDNADNPVTDAELDYTAADPSSDSALVSGKNTESLIVQGTKTEIDNVLSSLTVAFSADADADDYTIRVTADDRLYDSSGSLTSGANGGPGPDNADGTPINAANNRVTQDIALRASNDNDAPSITNTNTYSVNEDSQVTLDGFTLTDADSFGEDVTATVELYTDSARTTLADANTQGSLLLGDTTGLTASSGDDSNTITLTGPMSNVQAALNDLQFEGAPDYNGPVQGTGELYLRTTFADFDHADGQRTDVVDNDIEITPVNDQPTLSVPADQTLDSGTSIAISGFAVADTADTDQGADDFITVEIAATQGGTSDGTIDLTSSGGATVTNGGTANVTVNGTAADVQATMNSMDYAPSDPNADQTILMTVTADDRDPATGNGNGKEGVGEDGNNTVQDTFDIDVSATNDGPSVDDPSSQSVAEDESLTFSSDNGNAFSVSDPDDFGADMVANVSVDHGIVTAASGSGATLVGDGTALLTITGTESQINAALDGLVYTPDADFHTDEVAPDTITVTVNDQGNTGNGSAIITTQESDTNVTQVNDRPDAFGGPENVTETGENETGPPETLSTLLSGNYDDSTDNQTDEGGGNTATPLSFVAITGSTGYDTAQGTWQVSDGSGGWIDAPTSGLDASNALVVDASREIRFDPAADFHGTPGTLDIRLADGDTIDTINESADASDLKDLSSEGGTGEMGRWSADSVTIQTSVTNENDPPSATGDATLPAADEDATDPTGDTVADLFSGVFDDSTDVQTGIGGNDASTSLGGIAIVGNAADASTEGTWQYSTDNGGSWTDIATPGDTSAIILPNDARLRFVPVGDYNGAPGDLDIRLADADQSFNSSVDISEVVGDDPNRDTDIWSDVSSLDTSVTPVNDAPSASPSQNFTVNEDDGSQTATSFMDSLDPGGGSDESGQTISFNVADVSDGTNFTAAELFDTQPGFTDSDGSDNTLAFTPSQILADGESETVTVTVDVTDDGGTANGGDDTGTDQTFTITINGENDRPTLDAALPDQTNVDGETISVDVSGNFSDVDASDTLTYSAGTTLPTGLTIDTNTGVISGTIDDSASQNGPYSVTITADDNSGTANATQTDTFEWTVTNPAPTATDNTGAVTEDGPTTTTGNVIDDDDGNGVDSDPDDPASQLVVSAVDGNSGDVGSAVTGNHGTLQIDSGGGYTYNLNNTSTAVQQLASGETLTDSFDYTLSDQEGGTDTATLTVTVNGANDVPVAADDTDSTNENTTISQDAANGVLPNDADPDTSDTLTVAEVGGDAGNVGDATTGDNGGVFTIDADGSYSFDPGTDFDDLAVGESRDTAITYQVSDGNGGTDIATLTVTVTGENDAPVADQISNVTTDDGDAISVAAGDAFTDPDGNNLSYTAAGLPDGVTIDPDTGAITGDLPANASQEGPYEVSVTADDGNGGATDQTFTITSNNVAPIAADDTDTTSENAPTSGNVITGPGTDSDGGNDTDDLSVAQVEGDAGNVGNATAGDNGGQFTINADGSYDFDPGTDFDDLAVGESRDTAITYQVSDGQGGTDTATQTVTVNGENDAPVANDDTVSATEDTPATYGPADLVDPNDTDVDGDSLEITAVNNATNGTIVLNGDGTVTFTPAPEFNGTASFDYTISDGNGGSDTATVTVNVAAVNDVPVAVDDTDTTDEDTAISRDAANGVIPNDTDADGDALTVAQVAGAAGNVGNATTGDNGGAFNINADGSYDFDPGTDFDDLAVGESATTSVTYQVADGNGGTDTATLTVTVNGANDIPVAADDTDSTTENASTSADVLANDTDPDTNDTLTIAQVDGDGANVGNATAGDNGGEFMINGDGSYSFDPKGDFDDLADGESRDTTVSYTASDSNGGTDTATLTVTVTGVNDAPTTTGLGNQTSDDGEAISVDTSTAFSDAEGDDLSYTAAGLPDGVTINPNTGEISGTLDFDASTGGPYAVTVSVDDGNGGSETAGFTWTVNNPAPVAANDTDSTDEDTSINRNAANGVLNPNDSDTEPDGDALTVDQVEGAGGNLGSAVAGNNGGQFTVNGDGSYSFDPNGEFEDLAVGESRTTTVSYRVTDSEGGTDTATLTVTVTGVNDAPTTTGLGNQTSDDGEAISVDTSTAFSDAEGDDLSYTAAGLPDGVTINPNTGEISGTLDFDASTGGPYAVTVSVDDGNGGSETAGFTWTVNNPAPVAANDTDSTDEDTSINRNAANGVLNPNDSDTEPDGDALKVAQVGGDAGNVGNAVAGSDGGEFTINADGSYDFDPGTDFDDLAVGESRDTTIEYQVSDGQGGTDTATLTVAVNGENNVPVAGDDTDSTTENAPTSGDVLANDTDPDTNDTLTIAEVNGASSNVGSAVTGSGGGAFMINADGSYDFDPGTDFDDLAVGESATTSVTYQVADGNGGTDTATLTVTVNGANDAPVADDDNFTTAEDSTSGPIDLLAGDTDPENDTLSVESIAGTPLTPGSAQTIAVPNGTVNVSDTGEVTFTPDADYNGPVSFDYVVSDGNGGTDTGTVNGIVTADDTPAPADDSFTIDEDATLSDDVSGNDPGLGDVPVTYSVAAGDEPAHGTVNMSGDGTFDYTPNAGYNGSDSFTYTVTDDDGDSATATVNITVNPADDGSDGDDGDDGSDGDDG
ncbi:MAG: Ig-like domain-containing protein, partial [Haloarculaceae archaeon]